jgi:predicted DNA binding protein
MASNGNFGLTSAQREALTVAYEAGYFDVPSKTTLDSLSDVLDVTSQSVSERLNRGTKKLVEATLIDE